MSDLSNNPMAEVFISRRNELRALALRIIGAEEVAEDVVQEAYLKLVEGACNVEVVKPYAYCSQVVRNLAIDFCRNRAVEISLLVPTPDGDLPDVASYHKPDGGVGDRQLLDQVDAILDGLPERTRLVFELYRLHGLTQREIGKAVGVSATLVNFMIKDAVNALAACRDVFYG